MGELFHCPACERPLPLSADVAGVRIECPGCGHMFLAPSGTGREPSAEPVSVRASGLRMRTPEKWWVRQVTGRTFGPVDRAAVEAWLKEGRVGPGCLVAYEGAGSWRPIEQHFAALCAAQIRPGKRRNVYAPGRNLLAGLPMEGLLDAIADESPALSSSDRKKHQTIQERLAREVERSTLGLQWLGARSVRVGDGTPHDASSGTPARLMADSAVVGAVRWMEQEFHVVVPVGKLGQLPHEFFSVLPGGFATALGLRRLIQNRGGEGLWLDSASRSDSLLALDARDSHDELAEGVDWRWVSDDGNFEMILVWGMQVIPLGPQATLHVMQTAMQGALRRTFGFDWYLHRQHAFVTFRDVHGTTGDHEPHFLFANTTAQILNRLAGR